MPPDMDDAKLRALVHGVGTEIAKQVGDRVAIETANMERRVVEKIDDVRSELASKIDDVRSEMLGKVDELGSEVKEIKREQKAQGEMVAAMDQRLQDGDRRFTQIEERMKTLEKREQSVVGAILRWSIPAALGTFVGFQSHSVKGPPPTSRPVIESTEEKGR